MRRLYLAAQFCNRLSVEEIFFVPDDVRVAIDGLCQKDRVHIKAAVEKRHERLTSDETSRPGDKNSFQLHGVVQSGQFLSVSEMMRVGISGHSMPNAGSSYRTPGAASRS